MKRINRCLLSGGKMKKTTICTLCIIFALLLIGLFIFLLYPSEIPVDNEKSLAEIQKDRCNLEQMLLAEAIFYVRDGFRDVEAAELAQEAGLKLECRRQISATEFYYVVGYGTYRCFLFTDAEDIVDRVMYFTKFRTIADVKKDIELINAAGRDYYSSNEYGLAEIGIEIGMLTGGFTREYILADGVLVIETPFFAGEGETLFHFYTDEEWKTAQEQWRGYTILPIDKQNQPIT